MHESILFTLKIVLTMSKMDYALRFKLSLSSRISHGADLFLNTLLSQD